jgi:hypothetical protein
MRTALKQKDDILKQKEEDMRSAIKQKEEEMRVYSKQKEEESRLALEQFNTDLNTKDRLLLTTTQQKDDSLRIQSDDYQA